MVQRRNLPIIAWAAIGVIVPTLIGVALGVLAFSDLDSYDAWISKSCLLLAYFVAAVQVILYAARKRTDRMSFVYTFLACGILGVLGLASVSYVNRKLDRKQRQELPAARTSHPSFGPSASVLVIPTPTPTPPPAMPSASVRKAKTSEAVRKRREKLLRDLHNPDAP
jgi:hypothetical protein